jgi:hypothetical protein
MEGNKMIEILEYNKAEDTALVRKSDLNELMNINEVVKKILGPIDPIGETNTDDKRLINLQNTIKVVDELLSDIKYVAEYSNCQAHSMNKAGKLAERFLNEIGINKEI